MKRKLGAVLFVIYSIIAILVTVLLLSFNDYGCSEIGGYTVYIANDDSLEPEYKQGSIILMKSTSDRNVKAGDDLFFYKVINSKQFELVNRKLTRKIQQGSQVIYEVEQEKSDIEGVIQSGVENYSTNFFIGKASDAIVIEGPWGTILSILESKWGYLFCIVVVSLLLFLQEVFDLIIEIKYGGTKGTKAANVANARKAAAKGKTTTTKTATAKKATTQKTTTTPKATTTAKTVAKTVATVTKANGAETGEKED